LAARAFEDAQRLYDQGDYRGAIERFQCSYRLVDHPNTLFNIGESAELAGDNALALRVFRTYLRLYPDGQGRDQAQNRVTELEEIVDEEETPPPDRFEEEPQPEEPEPEPDRAPQPPPTEMRTTSARRAAWATLALGVAIAGTGGGLFGAAVSRNGDYVQNRDAYNNSEPTDWTEADFDNAIDEGQSLESAGWALMGIGAATLVTSIVLFTAFDGSEPAEASSGQALVAPVIGAGVAGVAVGGQF
jgi:tetratricopeptide (TPR) repeat protein